MLTIILVEIEHAQNLGAVCRVMANFGMKDIVLINPKCKKDEMDALKRAKHAAAPILQNAKITDFAVLKSFDMLIGTTARTGTAYNIARSPFLPEEMATMLHEKNLLSDSKVRVGLVIGREGHGLSNTEIEQCDYIVTIPTDSAYDTMNVSHAVAILLYEIYKKLGTSKIEQKYPKATAKDKEVLLGLVEKVLKTMDFESESKQRAQRITWKRIIGKAILTKQEARVLMGFLRKL